MRLATLCLLLIGAATTAPAAPRDRIGDELVLDIDKPYVTAKIGQATLLLRVDFASKDVVELNTPAAIRTGLPFENGFEAVIGPISLPGIMARGVIETGGYSAKVQVSNHKRDCCIGADGMIAPDMLPYRTVRLVRAAGPAPGEVVSEQRLDNADGTGLNLLLSTPKGPMRLQLALWQSRSIATAAAGARLAQMGEGRLTGAVFNTPGPFGIDRPSRLLKLGQPVKLGGFRFDQLAMRLGDFRGNLNQPAVSESDSDDILVEGRRKADQFAWPVIYVGRDRLAKCSEISFRRKPDRVTLSCLPPLAAAG
ncbi:hypothetical protein PQ455_17680 [Sphingomonas naphthae]|uniref:Quinoprotein dehydrogenase-associated SoxYZ-like carrier n=1 Tax=Sphingomonas naphthae TaxID=1813468 RepID=A0ABY7TJK7_9SPHN|nr:hypothetical protein [Sphingomonas naphthae]WCT73413.1 hypothetical protein PQ455_17680 [Sphingomonas naphthae]